ncbi:MAG TPA: DUF559 domain-containing protein [Polyangiaceae bacterium]
MTVSVGKPLADWLAPNAVTGKRDCELLIRKMANEATFGWGELLNRRHSFELHRLALVTQLAHGLAASGAPPSRKLVTMSRRYLIVEVDGNYPCSRGAADAARDAKLARLGWRVLRIPAGLVVHRLPELEAVRDCTVSSIQARSSSCCSPIGVINANRR